MAKISRACLGALLLVCVALPVVSAEQQKSTEKKAKSAQAQPAPRAAAHKQRSEALGDALLRIQQDQQPAKAAPAPAKATQPTNGEALVTVKVSAELEENAAFQALLKTLPHAIMNDDAHGIAKSDLLLKQKDVAALQRKVDVSRNAEKNAKLDELANSLRAVQAVNVDLLTGVPAVLAAQDDSYNTPTAPSTSTPTPEQVEAQALGQTPAPEPTPAPAGATDTPGVFGAAPAGNPTPEPAPGAAPAVPAAPAAPVADPNAPAPDPNAPPADPNAPAADPNAPVAESGEPIPPVKRDEVAIPEDSAESNAEISSKMREIAERGADAVAEEGVTNANGRKGTTQTAAASSVVNPPAPKVYQGDPMLQRVNLDFREMELSNVVALLASKAGINVIAGTDLVGTVTANLRDVPLRQAIETALRMNGLGMLEEEGIYRIVPYEEAQATQRVNQMVNLKNAKADEIKKVLDDILKGSPDERFVNTSANTTANVLVVSGPVNRVPELVAMANQLDIAKPVLPTITEAIKLNYAEPKDVLPTVTAMLSKDIGKVAVDDRARHLVVTDVPVNVENVRNMVKELDMPTKTVAIEAMIVDVTLTDDAETGVDWVLNLLRSQSRRSAAPGGDGRFVGDLQNLTFDSSIPGAAEASTLSFGLLTGKVDLTGLVKAEIKNFNGKLMSSPSVLTVENKPATITIAEEIPYIELVQTAAGGQQNKTSFKDVGTNLEVTPRVTHDDYIISQVRVKESNTSGSFNNVPIENKRELTTSLRMANGQTVFMGGLRKNGDELNVRKVPVLGDIPVVNVLFRNNKKTDRKNELVVFLTCTVVKDSDEMTPYQQDRLSDSTDPRFEVNAGNELFEYTVHPGDLRDPVWKYRRSTR